MSRPLIRAVLVLAGALLLATPSLAKSGSSLDVSLKPADAAKKLASFRTKVCTLAGQNRHPVVVFDVDDTLVRLFTKKQVPGATDFVKGCLADGARVIYQCGRKESQRPQTEALLTGCGLPLNDKAQLWLKANSEKAKTLEWKKSQKPQIEALGFPVGFFDNEKNNSRMFRSEFPKSSVFRLNTTAYYPDPGGTGTVWVINNFSPAPK